MNNWLAWSLLSALFAGATAVLAKISVTGIDSSFATAIRTTVILFFTWMIASFTRSHWSFASVSSRTWLFLRLFGLATGLSWLCYFRALRVGEASRVAPMDKLSVLFAILFAAVVLRETLTWHHWIGGGLVLTGAVILAFK
jgi:bacterial/archaeal transporter family protein